MTASSSQVKTNQRYSIIPADFVDDPRPQLVHFRAICFMGRHTNRYGWCVVSQSKMARRFGVARETINRAIRDLVEWGYVDKREAKGGGLCQYRVLMDRHEPPPVVDDDEDQPESYSTGGVRHRSHPVTPKRSQGGVTSRDHTNNDPSFNDHSSYLAREVRNLSKGTYTRTRNAYARARDGGEL